MTWSRAFLVGLAVGALMAACGPITLIKQPDGGLAAGAAGGGVTSGSGGGSASTPDGGLAFRLACPTLNSKRCELLRSCGLIDDTSEAFRDCQAWLNATWCGPTKWSARVDANTLRYDSLKAQACANDWAARACPDWATEPSSCQRIVSPSVPLGGRCYGGLQECSDGVCRGGACPRTCQVRGSAGDVCTATSDCQPTLFCRPGTGSTTASQCAAYSGDSMPCGTGQLCAPGLTCALGTCHRLPAAEQSCFQGRCDETAFCLAGSDGGSCESRRDAGEGCTDDTQCQPSLVCETGTQSCVPSVVANVGGPCTPRQTCPTGSTCLVDQGQSQGICSAPKRLDEACSSAADCQSHLTCTTTDGGSRCATRRPNGSACVTSRDCLALSVCSGGTCQAQPGLGERCSTSLPCLWGSCFDGNDGGAVCIEPQGAGQPCRTGADCASERCEQGLCTAACLP